MDLVTETDKACEDLIFNHLKQHFPTHKVNSCSSVSSIKISLKIDAEKCSKFFPE